MMAQRVRPGVLLALLVVAALPAMAAERISVDPATLPPPAPGASATNPP
ncbi:MAG: hypothetical protein HQL34_12425, partial [Alphaproteobacteria bacterium]|nr:hypothetical protein [Alphaproteobacteria bacterium]